MRQKLKPFKRNIFPASSGSKGKPNKQLAKRKEETAMLFACLFRITRLASCYALKMEPACLSETSGRILIVTAVRT
jgi:hypothetical protein